MWSSGEEFRLLKGYRGGVQDSLLVEMQDRGMFPGELNPLIVQSTDHRASYIVGTQQMLAVNF